MFYDNNFLIGNEALAMAEQMPPKRVPHFIEDRDIVIMPRMDQVSCWFYGKISKDGPEMFFVEATVNRPSTGQQFCTPVFISMFHNEIKDVDGKVWTNSVDWLDLDNANSLLEQFKMLAGKKFSVEVHFINVAETHPRTHEPVVRRRRVYTWHIC